MSRSQTELIHHLAARALPAIRFVPVFPPVHPMLSLTFFGGLPRGPHGLTWPRAASGRAMLFLGQVALRDLPDLPELPHHRQPRQDGTLWFFLDAEQPDGGSDPAVIFARGASREWPELDPPAGAQTTAGLSAMSEILALTEDPDAAMPVSFRKREMQAVVAQTFPDAAALHLDAAEAPAVRVLGAALRHAAEVLAIGPATPARRRIRAADMPGPASDRPLEGLPPVWLSLELYMGALLMRLARPVVPRGHDAALAALAGPGAAPQPADPDLPALCHRLVRIARRRGRMTPMKPAEHAAFAEMTATLSTAIAAAGAAVPHRHILADIAPEAISACLLCNGTTAALIGPDQRAMVEGLHRAPLPGLSAGLPLLPQMLGHPPRHDPGAPRGLLLMQFGPDAGIGWRFGGSGAVQYRIGARELEAGDFGAARVWEMP